MLSKRYYCRNVTEIKKHNPFYIEITPCYNGQALTKFYLSFYNSDSLSKLMKADFTGNCPNLNLPDYLFE